MQKQQLSDAKPALRIMVFVAGWWLAMLPYCSTQELEHWLLNRS